MKFLSLGLLGLITNLAAAQPGAQPTAPIPTVPPAPPPPGAQVLTLEQAIDIAMKQQPSLRQARAQTEAAQGRVEQARVGRRPTVSLSAGAEAGSTSGRPCATDPTMTCGGGYFTSQYSTPLGASLNWRIYDFGQTSANIRAAELNAEATAATVTTNQLDVRTDVELAYLEAVARERLITVADTTVKSEENHRDQARRFVAAGSPDPIAVAQAQSRAANAKSALAQAQSTAAIALANLRSAIGWTDPSNSPTVAAAWPVSPESDPEPLVQLVDTARKSRPEIVQLDKLVEAADASLDAARAERRPVLSANAGTQWTPGSGNWSPDPTWQAGITLSWFLYDGGKSSADQHIARANLESSIAQRDALLVTLTSQLDSARSQIVANRENVRASNEAVTAAQAQLKLAEARYAQGLGSQIELADAQTAVTTAQGNLVTAEWQLANAWAELHRATAK